jgi:hypothetical protein
MSLALYLALLRLTLTDPPAAAAEVMALLAHPKARWLALGAVMAVSAALGLAGELLFTLVTGVTLGPAVSPVLMAGLQGLLLIYTAGAMTVFGRQFAGTGRFAEAMSLVIWIQAVMVAGQVAQMLVIVLFPLVGVLLTLVLFGVMLWLITLFTAALHGFTNLMLVGAGVLTVFFGSAMLFGSVMLALGLAPPFMAAN